MILPCLYSPASLKNNSNTGVTTEHWAANKSPWEPGERRSLISAEDLRSDSLLYKAQPWLARSDVRRKAEIGEWCGVSGGQILGHSQSVVRRLSLSVSRTSPVIICQISRPLSLSLSLPSQTNFKSDHLSLSHLTAVKSKQKAANSLRSLTSVCFGILQTGIF